MRKAQGIGWSFICVVWAIVLMSWTCALAQTVVPYIALQTTTYTSTTTGTSVNLVGSAVTYHEIAWHVTGGTLATCSVQVDSSADNVSWSSGGVITTQSCTSNGNSSAVNVVANYIRVNVTAISTATGTPTLSVTWTGYANNPSGGGGGGAGDATFLTADGTGTPPTNYQVLTAGANITLTPGSHTNTIASNYVAAPHDNGTCTTAVTINEANGYSQKVTLTDADTCVFTFTQTTGTPIFLEVIQSSPLGTGQISGGYWPSGTSSGFTTTPPVLSLTAGNLGIAVCRWDGAKTLCNWSF